MRLLFLSLACACAGACSSGGDVHGLHPDAGLGAACPDGGTTVVCTGTVATTCNVGVVASIIDCAASGSVCAPALGCRGCVPHAESCDGETLGICRGDGSGVDVITTCDPATTGQHCTDVGCVDLCARAAADRSYVGCEYFAVPTLNPELQPEFDFAVVVTNPNLVAADVTITRGSSSVMAQTVAPGDVATINLPWVPSLRETTDASVLERGGAYRIVSSVPVIVVQFNPLEFRLDHDCAMEPLEMSTTDHQCYSFTNDASLLLPTTALTGSYIAISRPTLFTHETVRATPTGPPTFDGDFTSPGFVTIVGADTGPVTVTVTAHGHIAASVGATGTAIPSLSPGDMASFTLAPGDVVQLVGDAPATCPVALEQDPRSTSTATVQYCPLGNEWDLTGTEIRATGKIAVISGHSCDFVPYDRWACDHLEEQMFPVETWDTDAVVSLTQQLRGEPNIVRIVSATAVGELVDNVVSFDPPSVHAPISLGRFEYADVTVPTDVHVTGTGPIAVAQFLVGQDYAGLGASGPGAVGDPSMGLAVPVSQERSDYTFLVPSTYTTSYVNITGPADATVLLDGHPVGGFVPVGASGLTTSRIVVRGGVHHASADRPFALLVYGYASYTSYLYTGGLNFRVINPPI